MQAATMNQPSSSFPSTPNGQNQTDSSAFIPPPATSTNGNVESPRLNPPASNASGNGMNGNYAPGYGMYPSYYPPNQQQQYPQQSRHYPAYPPNGNNRYNESYPTYPHQPFYPMPPIGVGAPGPGPGTMQNYSGGPNVNPSYTDYNASNYMRQPYPRSYQSDPNAPSQPPSNFNDANGSDNNSSMNEAPPYTSHPPPPSIPPPGPPIPTQSNQGGQGQAPGDYGGGGGYYWPTGHPYSYGGGVGYPNPGVPYGYPYDPYNQPQHPSHFQQQHQYPQNQYHPSHQQPPNAANWTAINGNAPQQQRDNSATSGTSAGSGSSSSKLNPAAAGFTFTPAKKDTSSQNDTIPVFASLAQPSTSQASQPSNTSIPNGTHTSSQPPKKFSLPVVVDGEKFKGIRNIEGANGGLVFGSQPPESTESVPPALGLTQMNGTPSKSSTSPETSISASTPLSQSVTTASTPASPPTPTSVTTPRAADADIPADGEATVLFSPRSALSPKTEGSLRFVGSPVSGYNSPPSLSAAINAIVPPKRKAPATVGVEPYVLVAVRPEATTTGGVTYDKSLGKAIPDKYKVENAKSEEKVNKKKAKQRSRPSKGALLIIGTSRDTRRAVKGERLSFGEMDELTPRAADVPIPAGAAEGAPTPSVPAKSDTSAESSSVKATKPATAGTAGEKSAPGVAPSRTSEEKSTPSSGTDGIPSASAPSQPSEKPTEAAPVAPKAKPSTWAALLKPAVDPKVAAAKARSEAQSQKANESKEQSITEAGDEGSRTPVVRFSENEAGPSRLPASPNGPASPVSQPKANGTAKPTFNYAAAAATNAGLTPAEELAKILAEGVPYQPQVMGKGKAKEVGMVPRGLINTGNMCFANTILQVLVYCPPFTELFEELGKRLKADLARKTPLLEAMIIFLREFAPTPRPSAGAALQSTPPTSGTSTPKGDTGRSRDSRKEAFVPENVYDAMKENKRFDSMRRGHQEDAEEYLGFFLNTLHEELLYVLSRTAPRKPASVPNGTATSENDEVSIQRPVSPDADTEGDGWLEVGKKQKTNVVRATETRESAITRLFGGTIRSILTTPGMKNSVTIEPYQPLQLDIQSPEVNSITDALRHLSQPEIVPGVWSASRKANVDATKQITVETFPRVLILHLKRFVFEMSELSVVKKSKPVAYGTELIIPPEIISPGRRQTPVKYKLFGVVYHHGYSAGGGHYTVAVSRPDNPTSSGQWIHFDDETVNAVPKEEVTVSEQEAMDVKEGKVREGGLSIGGRERCAYLLFYQRVRA